MSSTRSLQTPNLFSNKKLSLHRSSSVKSHVNSILSSNSDLMDFLTSSAPPSPTDVLYVDSEQHLDSLWSPQILSSDVIYACDVKARNRFTLNPLELFSTRGLECNLKPMKSLRMLSSYSDENHSFVSFNRA